MICVYSYFLTQTHTTHYTLTILQMAYTWELLKCEKEFFDGLWKNYEDSNGYSDEEMLEIKEAYVNGNTALFHEIVKLMNDDCDPNVSFWIHMGEMKYHMYRVANSLTVREYCGDITDILGEYTYDAVNSIEEIRQVVDYMTNAPEYLPINTISVIKKGDEIVYTSIVHNIYS